jgi:hypothetical protein
MINPANNQQSDQHYQYACQLMIDEGKSAEITKAELLKRGMTPDGAEDMIYNVREQMNLEKNNKGFTFLGFIGVVLAVIKLLFELFRIILDLA